MKLLVNLTGALLLGGAASLFLVNWTCPANLVLPHEPVFALSVRNLFWIVGGVALVAALFSLFDDQPVRQMALLAWLATNFVMYVGGVYWGGGHGLTGYLGGFSRTFGISAKFANVLGVLMLGYLLVVSYGSFLWLWWVRKRDKKFLKMPCPSCGGRIKFAILNLGQKIPCPHCQTAVTLGKYESLKISCFFCQEHIEFPAHARGEKISCPHCKMDITLKQSGATL